MKKSKILIRICATILMFVGAGYGYVQFKLSSTKKAVESHLINQKDISRESIEEIDPFIGNLAGDKNWLVYVKIKGDEKKYHYYINRSSDKVMLESYTLNGREYVE
jgi:flagellar basal body-associated protein FliL